jgi:predicted 3-demethylubiquinone-9 3-methyltransferase (glyoxalase superfamily)
MIQTGKQITPFLWFDQNAEEAAKFYTSVFKNSKIKSVAHYPSGAGASAGSVMTVAFELNGNEFTALNAGPMFKFTEAISFVVNCETQEEIDYYWDTLIAGGESSACGWLKDKYGLSWQITPVQIAEMYTSGNEEGISRAFQAMMKMVKLDLKKLQDAFNGN